MRMDRLTTKFQEALGDAQSLALGGDHQFIEPVHLLVALLDQEGGSSRSVLAKAGGNVNQLRSFFLGQPPRVEVTLGEIPVSEDLGRLLNVCEKLAEQHKDQYIYSR